MFKSLKISVLLYVVGVRNVNIRRNFWKREEVSWLESAGKRKKNRREGGKMKIERGRYFKSSGLHMDEVRRMYADGMKGYEVFKKNSMAREKEAGQERI